MISAQDNMALSLLIHTILKDSWLFSRTSIQMSSTEDSLFLSPDCRAKLEDEWSQFWSP